LLGRLGEMVGQCAPEHISLPATVPLSVEGGLVTQKDMKPRAVREFDDARSLGLPRIVDNLSDDRDPLGDMLPARGRKRFRAIRFALRLCQVSVFASLDTSAAKT
jgi:hypothetical protein